MKIATNHVEKAIPGIRLFSDIPMQTLMVDAHGALFVRTGEAQTVMLYGDGLDEGVAMLVGDSGDVSFPVRKAPSSTFFTISN